MSDQVTTQPTVIPIVAEDGGTYTAPTKAWDGAAVRQALGAGPIAAGFVPDTPITAEHWNDLLYRIGQGLASIVDAPAINWSRPATIDGEPNDNHWPGPADVATGALNVGVFHGYNFSDAGKDLLVQFNAARIFVSSDGHSWTDMGLHGADVADNSRGPAIGLQTGDSVPTIVVWESEASGQIRKSEDGANTWADAGTLPASFDGSVSFGGVFQGRFFICARSQLYYSDTLANAEWTRITTSSLGWTGAPPPAPTCVETSPTEIAIGINGAPSLIHSSDGNTWAAAALPDASGVKALHWSDSHARWIALAASGNIYSAPAGFGAWTECGPVVAGGVTQTTLRAVSSLGRAVVVQAGFGLLASRDLQNWMSLDPRYTFHADSTNGWDFLKRFNGRLWAGRTLKNGSDFGMQYTMSEILPAAFTAVGPW